MKHLFLGSNTPKGFFGFYKEQLKPLKEVYILKGGPGTGKSTLLKTIAKHGEERGLAVEAWHCSGDPISLDGVFLPELKTAIVDGTSPHALEADLPALKDYVVALGDHIKPDVLRANEEQIIYQLSCKKRHFNSAYCQINSAYCNLRAIYEPYSELVCEDKLSQLATSLASHVKHAETTRKQFSTALTPDGFVTYKNHLEEKQIVALKSSSLFVVKKFLSMLTPMLTGYSSYHCSFEPELAESLTVGRYAVVPYDDCVKANDVIELDTALKGSVNEEEGVEERKLYERAVALAIRHLSEARDCHKEVEKFYVASMDFNSIDKKTAQIEEKIFH